MKTGDRERSQLEVLNLEVALERRDRRSSKFRRAHREEPPNALLAESAQRELDDRRRRSIQPLEVVDGANDLRFAGECAEECEESGADDATLGRPRGGGAQERRVETHPLRLGQSREELVRYVGQQIREPREREPGFRLGRPRDQHSRTLRTSMCDRHLPQRRLADSRLADDRERAGSLGAQEALDGPQLGFAPDQARHDQRLCAAGLGDARARYGGQTQQWFASGTKPVSTHLRSKTSEAEAPCGGCPAAA